MMRTLLTAVLLASCTLVAATWATAAVDAGGVSLGVAMFERSGPPGEELPDVATLLADRIGTSGVERIVGPQEFGAPARAEPSASDVKSWASRAKVAAVVVGRTTRIGSQLSVDVRLLSGASGEVAGGPYIAEVSRGQKLAAAVDTLAGQVIDGAVALAAGPAPDPKGEGDEPGTRATAPSRRSSASSGTAASDAPMKIKSDSLEASEVNGRRRLLFNGNVKVEQADVTVTSRRLVADYPQGGSQPEKLVATGAVKMTQKGDVATCDEGTYYRSRNVLRCCGSAELRDGNNRVRGTCIEFNLADGAIRVENPTIDIFPDEPATTPAAQAPAGSGT